MSAMQGDASKSRWGRIEIDAHSKTGQTDPIVGSIDVYRWIPAEELHSETPPGFVLEMHVGRMASGGRFFFPSAGVATLIRTAALGGLAVLKRAQRLSPEGRQSYRASLLIFELVRSMREHLGRQFRYRKDLVVALSQHLWDEKPHVLPFAESEADSGALHHEADLLLDRGAEIANACGIESPTIEDKIQLALFHQALQHPISLDLERMRNHLRNALYLQVENEQEIDANLHESLEERIHRAIWDHLEDGEAQFQKWISSPGSSFVRQLAKQRKAPGGAVSQATMRQVILDVGWRSYFNLANLMKVQFEVFANALPEPLTTAERSAFDVTYTPQDFLNGLPLLLIHERLPVLKYAIMRLWDDAGNERLHSVVHTLLFYYSWMADERRRADREIQQLRKNRHGPGPLVQSLSDETESFKRWQRRDRDDVVEDDSHLWH